MRTAALAILLFSTAAHAQVGFKGLALGAPRAELLERFASLQCMAPPTHLSKMGEEICMERPCAGPACAASEKALSSYGGMPAWDVVFALVGGRVEQFTLSLSSSSYEAVRDALRDIHGAGKETVQTMQTRGGAAIESRVWSGGAQGDITVFERAVTINEARVVGESRVFSGWLRQPSQSRKRGDV